MEPAAQLTHVIPALNAMVDRIDPNQLESPTPCDGVTVEGVLDHLVVVGWMYSYILRGEDATELEPKHGTGHVQAAALSKALRDLFSAVCSPGAMERTVITPMGELPGEVVARFVVFDLLVHGRHLATATGQLFELSDDVTADVEDFARKAITPATHQPAST